MKKISESEQEIMLAIWNMEEEQPITASRLEAIFGEEKGWKKTSILTFLSRLVEKGYLSCERRGKTNFYTPLISYEQFSRRESRNILHKLYRNSLKNFVSALYDGEEMSKQDVQELRQFLDEISAEGKSQNE